MGGNTSKKMYGRAFRKDIDGNIIPALQAITDILNTSLTSSTWTAITLNNGALMACKSIRSAMRDGSDFRISHKSNGAYYATIGGSLEIDLALQRGERIFYAQSVNTSGILETVLYD